MGQTMSTISKMHNSNRKVRKWLEENNYKEIYFFPHGRFAKGYRNEGMEFDGLCSKGNKIVLFQVKSNKKISKELAKRYKEMSKKFGIICLWFNVRTRKKMEIYNEEMS
jgi:hypothetical protein